MHLLSLLSVFVVNIWQAQYKISYTSLSQLKLCLECFHVFFRRYIFVKTVLQLRFGKKRLICFTNTNFEKGSGFFWAHTACRILYNLWFWIGTSHFYWSKSCKSCVQKKTKPVSNGFCEARTFFLNLFLLYVDYRVFLKENVRNPVWICRDPMSPILGTWFSLVLGT